MMNFNKFLLAVSLMVEFGLSSSGVSSCRETCPIQFPEGFFCDLICEKWGILSGNTIMCFISNQGEYQRFVARNPAFGIWRFYKIDLASPVESVCESTVTGDEFFLNDTEIICPTIKIKTKRFHVHNAHDSRRRSNDYSPLYKSEIDVRIPMDAICELATTQICRQGKVIDCTRGNNCCYAKANVATCHEDIMSQFSDCYKVLHNVISNMLQ